MLCDLQRVVRDLCPTLYNNIILRSKNKIKSTWKIINSESGITHQDTSIPLLKLLHKLIANQHKIANLFNSYFLSVADSINGNMNKDVNLTMNNPISYLFKYYKKLFDKINWQYASTYEIRNIIKSLKPKNTYGYDEISNCIIKLSSPYTHIISSLTYISNAAFGSGVFPDRLKLP